MAAYATLTGVTWPLLAASSTTLAALWHFFGIYCQVVPEGSPAGIDRRTGQPFAYDVNHPDGFALLDPYLRERFHHGGDGPGRERAKSMRHISRLPEASTTPSTLVLGAGPLTKPSTPSLRPCNDQH
jgi:hypothetical protein